MTCSLCETPAYKKEIMCSLNRLTDITKPKKNSYQAYNAPKKFDTLACQKKKFHRQTFEGKQFLSKPNHPTPPPKKSNRRPLISTLSTFSIR